MQKIATGVLVVVAGSLITSGAHGQESARVRALEQKVEQMERRHQREMRDLRRQLRILKGGQASSGSSVRTSLGGGEVTGTGDGSAAVADDLPKPHLILVGSEDYTVRGREFTRYRLAVENQALFADSLFRAAPELPPCGRNRNSSRTWVNILRASGKYIYGFCGFRSAGSLGKLWFAVKKGERPPAGVKIELKDRATGRRVESNLVKIR